MVEESYPVRIGADEKRWRAEEDARTIARYLEIIQDKERVKLASNVAKMQVEKLSKELNAMRKVARKGAK